jgi:hypothetical protein
VTASHDRPWRFSNILTLSDLRPVFNCHDSVHLIIAHIHFTILSHLGSSKRTSLMHPSFRCLEAHNHEKGICMPTLPRQFEDLQSIDAKTIHLAKEACLVQMTQHVDHLADEDTPVSSTRVDLLHRREQSHSALREIEVTRFIQRCGFVNPNLGILLGKKTQAMKNWRLSSPGRSVNARSCRKRRGICLFSFRVFVNTHRHFFRSTQACPDLGNLCDLSVFGRLFRQTNIISSGLYCVNDLMTSFWTNISWIRSNGRYCPIWQPLDWPFSPLWMIIGYVLTFTR